MLPGVSRARRAKTGNNKGVLILISDAEKLEIEKAAARKGVSMSRFIVERALKTAKRVLAASARKAGESLAVGKGSAGS